MNEASIARTVPRREALGYWWRLGWLSFGGPAGQIAMMHADIVEKRRWLSEGRFLHGLNYTMALPGPEAQQLAIYIGWLLHGTWGGIVAGTLFVLPSLLLMIAAGWAYVAFGGLPAVDGLLWGIKPVVVAIVAAAAWRIGRRVLRRWVLAALAIGAFVAMAVLNVPFPLIIGSAAAVGALCAWRRPAWIAGAAPHEPRADAAAVPTRAVVDDDTPPPRRAQFSWRRLGVLAATGAAVWAAGYALVVAVAGQGSVYAALSWFFTKVALVTFGGAYAVLPYVYQAVVLDFGWLTTTQMIDGLALGESTPGPLIMVVAFVGYLVGAADGGFTTGAAGALVVTFFTFLPSYLFILLGAPLVEATRGELRLSGPLTAITAAVVGVIANLAVFFAGAVFITDAGAAWDAVALALAALALLVTDRISVPVAVIAGGAIGLAMNLM